MGIDWNSSVVQARTAKAVAAGAAMPTYTTRHLIESMRSVATDGYLSMKMYREAYEAGVRGERDPLPSPSMATIRWGSWNAAVEAAGLTHGKTLRTYERMSNEELAAHVRVAAETMGDAPTVSEYTGFRLLNPELGLACEALIRRRLGGWAGALRAAAQNG